MSPRNLQQFTNADGSRPTGVEGRDDDSVALARALAAGPGVVEIGAGHYRFGAVLIPNGVTLRGAGAATVVRSNGAPAIFVPQGTTDWAIRDLVVDGEGTGDWRTRRDEGRSGVNISRCWGYEITGVTVRNFPGAGLQVADTPLGDTQRRYCHGGTLERVTAHGNASGIRFDRRGEYLNASSLSVFQNVTGVVIHAGNVKLAASNICSNTDGILIEDKENGSHGAVGTCLINHNERHALLARRVVHGMTISNCCFFYGDIVIEDSQGVLITASELCCDLRVTGAGANRIAGNYVIPHPDICRHFSFAPATIVADNFTAEGPWQPPG